MFRNKISSISFGVLALALIIGGLFLTQQRFKADTKVVEKPKEESKPQFISNQILIKLKPESVTKLKTKHTQLKTSANQSVDAQAPSGIENLDITNKNYKALKMQKTINRSLGKNVVSLTDSSTEDIDRWYTIDLNVPKKVLTGEPEENKFESKISPTFTYRDLIDSYRATAGVEKAEPVYMIKADMIPNDMYYSTNTLYPNTPGQTDLWHLNKIKAGQAWDKTTGNGVVVAVVDSGVDYNHPDLKDNILRDADGSIIGYDFVNNDTDPMDDHGHGTHVAGIIASRGNNDTNHTTDTGKRVIGVGPNLKIMPIKALDGTGSGGMNALMNAEIFAADHGAKVVNNSWGRYDVESSLERDTVKSIHDRGVVAVFSSGNSNVDIKSRAIQGDSNVITIGSSNFQETKSDFSNYGIGLDLVAPGGSQGEFSAFDEPLDYILSSRLNTDNPVITSTDIGNYYRRLYGTSQAAPQVTAAAALILSMHPNWSPEEVRFALRNTTDLIGGQTGYSGNYGFGRLNVAKAVSLTTAPPVAKFDLIKSSSFNVYDVYGAVSAAQTVKNWSLEMGKVTVSGTNTLPPTTWQAVVNGTTAKTGKLATLSYPGNGRYLLRLKVVDNVNQSSQTYYLDEFYKDTSMLPGWPIQINDNHVMYYKNQSAIGDINGDGKNEVILLEYYNNTSGNVIRINAYNANGAQINNFPKEEPFGWQGYPSHAVLADVNNDGKQEIIFSMGKLTNNIVSGKVYIYDGSGNKLPGWPVDVKYNNVDEFPGLPTIADINSDGQMEILVQTSGGHVFVYKNNGQVLSGWPIAMGGGQYFFTYGIPAVGDINIDGKTEIIAGQNGKIYVFDSVGRVLTSWPKNTFKQDDNGLQTMIADINNDNKPEIITRGLSFINAIKNDGTNLWFYDFGFRHNGASIPTMVKSPDAKGIFVSTTEKLFKFITTGSVSTGYPINLQKYYYDDQISVADVNNDSQPEIISYTISREEGRSIVAYNLSGQVVLEKGHLGTDQNASIADINGDGKLEMIGLVYLPNSDPEWITPVLGAWFLPTVVSKNYLAWPQVGGNPSHSGVYPAYYAINGKLTIKGRPWPAPVGGLGTGAVVKLYSNNTLVSTVNSDLNGNFVFPSVDASRTYRIDAISGVLKGSQIMPASNGNLSVSTIVDLNPLAAY